jgi:hypothetical protein
MLVKPRKTLRETLLENRKAEQSWANAFGTTLRDDLEAIADKRSNSKRMDDDDREETVMREVSALLAHHPKVLFAIRQNSGMSENASGTPIWFYRWVRSRTKMRVTDFWGLLTDGRMFALEAKNRLWKAPSGEREFEQQEFLTAIREAGGVAGFVTSAAQAQKIIEG